MLHRVLLVLATFGLLYGTPIIGGMNAWKILTLISCAYLMLNLQHIHRDFFVRKLINIYSILIFILLWIFTLILFNESQVEKIHGLIYFLISVIPVSLMIGREVKRRHGTFIDLVDIALIAAFVQGIFSVLSFLFPSVQNFFVSQMTKANFVIMNSQWISSLGHRVFGYASGLTFTMPVVQSFLGMLALFLALDKSMKYMIYVPVLLFSAIINGRLSFVVIGICSFVLLIKRGVSWKQIAKAIIVSILGVVLVQYGISLIQVQSFRTFKWIGQGFTELAEFVLEGRYSSGYFSYAMNPNKWKLPEGIDAVIGQGTRVMGWNATNAASDVGYVNDVWLGGFLYCVVAYYLVYKAICGLKSASNPISGKLTEYLSDSFLLCALALNVKGYIIDFNNFSSLFILFAVFNAVVKNSSTGVCRGRHGNEMRGVPTTANPWLSKRFVEEQ